MGLGEAPRITKAEMVTIERDYVEDIKMVATTAHEEYKKIAKDMGYIVTLLHRVKCMYPEVYGECLIREDFDKLEKLSKKYDKDLQGYRK